MTDLKFYPKPGHKGASATNRRENTPQAFAGGYGIVVAAVSLTSMTAIIRYVEPLLFGLDIDPALAFIGLMFAVLIALNAALAVTGPVLGRLNTRRFKRLVRQGLIVPVDQVFVDQAETMAKAFRLREWPEGLAAQWDLLQELSALTADIVGAGSPGGSTTLLMPLAKAKIAEVLTGLEAAQADELARLTEASSYANEAGLKQLATQYNL